MADLQKELTLVSIREKGEQFKGKLLTGTVRLKCWNAGDNPETDPAVIDRTIPADYKDVPDLTVDQQLARWGAKIQAQAQAIIDVYLREQVLAKNSKLATEITTIQGNLTG